MTTSLTLPNVAILGRLRSGKDTVGYYLAEKYGYTQFAFADEMKADFHRRYPEVSPNPKPRACYQFHGELMRQISGENVWVDRCFTEINAVGAVERWDAQPFRAVITDVKMPHEADALNREGYVLIRIDAPDGLRIERAVNSGDTFEYADLFHGTETALDGYPADFTVTNDAGLPELYAQIDEIMAYLALKSGGEVA
ncbi:adenylate kinase [Paenibacillus graminis]|uniref:adenylate kinase n=1 Tax=Paenibacillus graminis TaxID=189425 RepID=UPI002DB90AD1|nr:adenylate kinase [Paenibacillus graminis]MEC0167884.1 adenylate kinase [Paenibacillus graminis]